MAKKFQAPVSADFKIIEDGSTVGWVRVKPSGVLWSDKGGHKWYGLDIAKFAELAKQHGSKLER